MTKIEIMELFEETFRQIILPELKEARIEVPHVSVILEDTRRFLFQQYEKREIEHFALRHALERIEQRLDALEQPPTKAKKERKPSKGTVNPRQKKQVR